MLTSLLPEFTVERDEDRCIQCRVCERQCSFGVFGYDAQDNVMVHHEENCVACQRCSVLCPTNALKIKVNEYSYKTPTGLESTSRTLRNRPKQAVCFSPGWAMTNHTRFTGTIF